MAGAGVPAGPAVVVQQATDQVEAADLAAMSRTDRMGEETEFHRAPPVRVVVLG